jgi:MraZ protein
MPSSQFLGEYMVTLDTKGRVMMPSVLHKQVPARSKGRFVINRGFEKHLNMYTIQEFDRISAEVNKLNLYVKANIDFARYFYRGATEVTLDGTNRYLIPRPLLDYAGIQRDAVLFAYHNRIEIWSERAYMRSMREEPVDFVKLAEQVMGGKTEQK